MASRFWTFVENLIPGQTARSEQVNAKFGEVEEGLDLVAAEMDRSIRFTYGIPTETTHQLPQSPAQCAGKTLGFDASGVISLLNSGFVWKGDWAGGTFYAVNDVVRAPLANNYSIYVCTSAHTSSSFSSDSSSWSIMIDLTENRATLILHTLVSGPQGNYPLVAGQDVMVDVTGGAVSFLLPASPLIGDQPINIMHVAGPVADNPITINGNGKMIMALAEPLIVNTDNASFGLAFCNDAAGWRIRGV
jgi:hypothetical protein